MVMLGLLNKNLIKMSLQNIQVIGFDLDNTLYPSTEEMQSRIRIKIYQKISEGLSIFPETAERLFEENYNGQFPWSQSGSRTIEEIAKRHDRQLDGKLIVQQSLEEADILDFINENIELADMLEKLNSRFHLDLITGSSYDLTFEKLKKLKIKEKIFGYILAHGRYGSKTNGEVYSYWISERQTSPEKMLYVGDNKKQDIDSPKRLGIRTCIVRDEYNEADYFIKNILELERLLK